MPARSVILYLPFKVPVKYDLVQPLANWLDDDESQVAFDRSSSNNNNNNNNYDAAPSMVIPKPAFTSVRCRSELLRIAALRNCISEALQDSHKSALQEHSMLRDCQDYHATLLEFEKRGFPTGDTDDENGLWLTWNGAFAPVLPNLPDGSGEQETHHTLLWDRACTLWNTAALRSAAAAIALDGGGGGDNNDNATTTTKDGYKTAISHLQHAASHLSLCRQLLEFSSVDEHHGYVSTVDLSKPMLRFWEKLLLAQAQACIYKMANLGGSSVRNHTTLAYLIQGAAPLYNDALTLAQDPRLQSELPDLCREWAAHCKAKSLLCQARACFHLSIELRLSRQAHGREIARLNQAIAKLEEVLRFCQKTTRVLKESNDAGGDKSKRKRDKHNNTKNKNPNGTDSILTPIAEAAATIQPEAEGLLKLATDRRRAASEDNRTVYLEDVPGASALPEIRAQTMAKTDLPLPEAMLVPRANLFGWE
mmetsp:Transcript_30397/g.63723  ORF Transcript_30397/g.63723 Transcript_30397/m.63723 type:complete len:478 (-) Transcript_30397:356-1789(-)